MKKILLIEDNATNRKLLGYLLRQAGDEVHESSNAEDGLVCAMKETFNLIVMDIHLPGMDGVAATHILRSTPATSRIPILAVTAHAMTGDERRIREAGCDGYVCKPIAYKVFLAEVNRLLDGVETIEGKKP
jgi:two-component system, cell cycle response regulator DivK